MIEPQPHAPSGEFLLYTTEDGQAKLEVRLVDETVWLSQAQLAELFQSTKQNVSQHIKNLFDEGELKVASVVKDFLTTAADGKNYKAAHFNLDVCISVGYRVKSHRGTQFRIWATQRLRVYSKAKTVADCFKFRNKIGEDVALEALRSLVAIPGFTVDELLRYAKICRIEAVIRPYLVAVL